MPIAGALLNWDRQHYTRESDLTHSLYELMAIVGGGAGEFRTKPSRPNCWMGRPDGPLVVENFHLVDQISAGTQPA